MLSILLAALSAGVWGTGDFSGGKASQKADPFAVTLISQVFGLPILLLCLLVFSDGFPGAGVLGRGAIAGAAGFIGIVLLYRGLSRGVMAIFAPVSAVTAAVVPMIVGLVTEGRPGTIPLIGACCAIAAIGLVSITGSGGKVTPGLIGLALASGTMFGIFFAVLGKSGEHTGMWPLLGVRIGSVGLGVIAALARRTHLRLTGTPLRWTAVAGVFDIVANALFLLAAAHGELTLVAPIASLYPVSTVLLALGVDHERVRPVQLAGLGLAATALVLVAS
ncbi:MAG TPA: EamA family transporter [Micromonosporaceae bacterium]